MLDYRVLGILEVRVNSNKQLRNLDSPKASILCDCDRSHFKKTRAGGRTMT